MSHPWSSIRGYDANYRILVPCPSVQGTFVFMIELSHGPSIRDGIGMGGHKAINLKQILSRFKPAIDRVLESKTYSDILRGYARSLSFPWMGDTPDLKPW